MNSGTLLDDWNQIEDLPINDLTELVIDIDGFEGPLDLLLTLSRNQKVDLLKISILQLVDQYMSFIDKAKTLRLELAADYLVMAAWLAFLKSRLLLPVDPDDGPSGDELATYLAFQLERLSGMRNSAKKLMTRDRLGQNFFSRGMPENIVRKKNIQIGTNLLDLLQAYARARTKDEFKPFVFERDKVYSMKEALERLKKLIVFSGDWTELSSYLPDSWGIDKEKEKSATASTFAASLELAKTGEIELKQDQMFAPIKLRKKQL
jgi:segregation and condensation protein A